MSLLLLVDKPQPILNPPAISPPSFSSAIISWEYPGGNVNFYLLTVTETASQTSTSIIVEVNKQPHVMLDQLRPLTNYQVNVKTVNDQGLSIVSPSIYFNTTS